MCVRRSSARLAFEILALAWASVALAGCSQEEPLVADPGASPFYPGTPAAKSASTSPGATPEKGTNPPGIVPPPVVTAESSSDADGSIDARFGTNEVERQLRVALRTANKGDLPLAAQQLDKILAVEPIHREALLGRTKIYMEQARQAKSPDDKAAAMDKAVALVQALRRAYDSPKPHEKDLINRVLFGKFRLLAEKGQVDQAIAALKTVCENGVDGFAGVDNDKSLESLRSTPQYQLAHKADDERLLAKARERTQGRLDATINLPFGFTLPDLDGKKVSLTDYKGKVVLVDYWGTWCGPCRDAVPFLINLHSRQHAHGLEIIGLNYEKNAETDAQRREMAKAFVKLAGIPYPCLLGDEQTVRQVPGFKGFPTSVIIDRAGKVRLLVIENDAQTPELINDTIRVLLAEPAPKAEAQAPAKPATPAKADAPAKAATPAKTP